MQHTGIPSLLRGDQQLRQHSELVRRAAERRSRGQRRGRGGCGGGNAGAINTTEQARQARGIHTACAGMLCAALCLSAAQRWPLAEPSDARLSCVCACARGGARGVHGRLRGGRAWAACTG
jgi:hypothetical protein